MSRPTLILCAVAVLLAACPRPGSGPKTSDHAQSALTIPPGPESLAAVRALEAEAEAGDVNAAWERAHYLIDLFDDARFRGAAQSRALLWNALGATRDAAAKTRGVEATNRAAAALISELEEVLALDRLHRSASSARVMLEFDRVAQRPRTELVARMLELKAAGTVETMRGNVALRLAGYCLRALDDATRGPSLMRARSLSHCLYPLYDADPEPYFATPNRRPPLPRWQDLINGAGNLLEGAIPRSDRLVPTLEHMRASLEKLRSTRSEQLPVELDPAPLNLPRADHADAYDWTPRLLASSTLGDLAGPLEGDGRGIVALPLPVGTRREVFDSALELARDAGANAVDLLVVLRQTLEIPAGDYWAQRGESATIERAGAIRLALDTSSDGDQTPQLGPRQGLWDSSRAQLGVHLIIEPKRWRLSSPSGEIVSVTPHAPKGDPRTELRVALQRVRQAYPEEAALVVVLEPGASYRELLRATSAVTRDARGRPLFRYLALGDQRPIQVATDLPVRIERRWRARVSVQPKALRSKTSVIRACYQRLLESHPELALTLTFTPDAIETSATGPAAEQARDCAADLIRSAMGEAKLERAVVELIPR